MINIPPITPRRPLDDDQPDGYQESDKDYVLNNIEAAVALLNWAQDPSIFLTENENGSVVKASSTLGNAFDFARANNFYLDFGRLNSIVEMKIDGETWGTHHSYEEMDEL